MARPLKRGLDYYPMDVGFLRDTKIRKIIKACGLESISVLICLLGNIYENEGYYMWWDKDEPFLVADSVGTSEGAVREIVIKAVQVGFFDEDMLKRYHILTSAGIQKRFILATGRRKLVTLDNRFLLIREKENGGLVNVSNNPVNVYNNSINVSNNPVNVYNNTQSKVKEIATTTIKDTSLAKVVEAYRQNIRPEFGPMEAERLKEISDRFGSETCIKAIKRAVVRGNRSLSYIGGILESWSANGYEEEGDRHAKWDATDKPKRYGVQGKTRKNEAGRRVRTNWDDVPDGWD